MKNAALLFILACCLSLNAAAQQQNVYYMKKSGILVSQVDSADYIRIVKPSDKEPGLFTVQEFYRSGNKKSIGQSIWPKRIDYDGQFISFFENGKRKLSTTYAKGKIVDSVYSYYPNGRLYSVQAYAYLRDSAISNLITLRDSIGTALVTNGNGTAVLYDDDFKYVTATGKIKNGKYDGKWSGAIRDVDTLLYKESYADGKMLSGESTDGKGNVYHYNTSELKPLFKGGENAFNRQVGSQMRYPPDLARQKIEGAVLINYTILANGEMSNVHAVQAAHPGLAAEAIRVLKTAKDWQPGVFKGRKVDVTLSMPMNFTLGH